MKLQLTFLYETSYERITTVSNIAAAHGIVIDNLTFCVNATHTGTRIFTFLINTRHIWSTLGANNTFWPTIGWRAYT